MSRKNVQHIKLNTMSSEDRTQEFQHENFVAGITPYLRGNNSTMNVSNPWISREFSDFSTVEETNTFYRKNIAKGQKDLYVALNTTTNHGFDSDAEEGVQAEDVKAGLVIDSVEDMKILFDQIPLDQISVFMSINGAVLPILAFYIVAAKEQGVNVSELRGAIQIDILKELMMNSTDLSLPINSMKISADIFEFTNKNMPKFGLSSISGCQLQEAGTTPELELAYTLAKGLEYLRMGLNYGKDIDTLALKLSFSWSIGMEHFKEIAKLRAGRMLWAKIVKQFNPKNQESLVMRSHSQTNKKSLTVQDPFNNLARTTIEAMAAAFGGTQSLYSPAFDAGMKLPFDLSHRKANSTQIYIQEETNITKTVDPWAGSYHVEELTENMAIEAWKLIQEVEEFGGLTKAIEHGIPKMRIEEAAAKKQGNIDSGEDNTVGVNKYQFKEKAVSASLAADNDAQIKRLHTLKSNRNQNLVDAALLNLSNCAKSGTGNLLELAIVAAERRATLEEMSKALKIVTDK